MGGSLWYHKVRNAGSCYSSDFLHRFARTILISTWIAFNPMIQKGTFPTGKDTMLILVE
jgi:hypothetical protein